jgi:hypothetical protein
MLSQKLTALNIQDLQYDFHTPKTLVRRGNYAANRGIVGCDGRSEVKAACAARDAARSL